VARTTPREEARKARSHVYRQHVLKAAEEVFAERGFEAARLQEISARAGLSMGTIYAIFPSKADLYRALLEERGRELRDFVAEVARRPLEPRDALGALIALYVDYFVAHPEFLRMHLRSGASWVLSPPGTETRVRHWQEIHDLQAEIFRRGAAAGVFVDEEPSYLAKLFSAIDQVLLADWVAGGMRADRDALRRRLTATVERALCRQPPAPAG
jgi:AcrR family transcriptional regulator